ncbi:MAG TPA: C-terminal binding protein [Thermodesulfobacteriota bacterium]|nr:C-terminal binding protein [Thermodesulfobacteriota bacterium]
MSGKVVARIGFDLTTAEKMLKGAGLEVVRAAIWTEEDLIRHAADADGVIVSATEPYTPRVIREMKKCRVISRMGIGYNNINVEEATRQGIAVSIVLDASVHEVSDHAMAFLLAFSRKVMPLAQAVRRGVWKPGSIDIVGVRGKMYRLTEQTLGLVGVGRIGSRMAPKGRAFGMRVIGYDPYLSEPEMRQRGVEKVDFDTLLKESDSISVHAPLTPETRGMFGLQEFRKMKPTAVIINTARGAIIREGDLHQALVEGAIAGAGLDVSDPEPPSPDNPLISLEQVLVSGHSAFYSETSMKELQEKAAEAIILGLKGEWPPTLANPEVKEKENRRIKSKI